MQPVFLLLGSNQGDRPGYLQRAIQALAHLGEISARSSLYETEAWGKTDQPAFLNQAICLETSIAPEALLTDILQIERELGRERLERYGPRTIDIDILLVDRVILRTETLTIPHPELPNRRFALTALAEIAPDQIHPVFGAAIAQLLIQCTDSLHVIRID